MGVPMVVINHTRKQYITFCGTNIGDKELEAFLEIYNDLIADGTWNSGDNIRIKNKHMECAKENKPEKWSEYELYEHIDAWKLDKN